MDEFDKCACINVPAPRKAFLKHFKKSFAKTTLTTPILVCIFITASAQGSFLDSFYVHGVPYVLEEPHWCGPACLSMVLGYWGVNITQQEIAEEIYDPESQGTAIEFMATYARERGYDAEDFHGSIDDIKSWLRDGVPLIVIQKFVVMSDDLHYRVVVGYNESSQTIITYDPEEGQNYTLTYTTFSDLWEISSNRTIAVTPSNTVLREAMREYQIEANLGTGNNYGQLVEELEIVSSENKQLIKELETVRSDYNKIVQDLENTRFTMQIFMVATIILLAITIIITTRYLMLTRACHDLPR
jgi:ABC-type bacteriocin/lantibiotic exporter with double-glycine peptidase domain